MSSINTNNGAMVALQTLKSINKDLNTVQNEISTGKKVNSAKDGSAIWAISKVMEADLQSFGTIQDSLAVGEATIAVASAGSEQIVNVLTEMKELAVSATSETADFAKIEAEMAEKTAQITSIIGAAQFNGVNLLATDVDGNGGTSLTVLSSLNRSGSAAPTIATVSIAGVDFEGNAGIDVSSRTAIADTASAQTALTEIEGYMQYAINSSAALGASAKRLSDQQEFMGKLSDAVKSGIGSLVDADMEEASARLQALQTQQQLGVQALSIANQAPQSILSLFR